MESLIRSVKLSKEPRRIIRGDRCVDDHPAAEAMIGDAAILHSESLPHCEGGDDITVGVNDEVAEYARREADLQRQLAAANERIAAWERDIDVSRREAIEQGHADGYRAGVEETRSLLHERVGEWDRLLDGARSAIDAAIASTEEASVEIVFEAMLKMIGRAATDREAVKGMVRQVLAQAQDCRAVVVRVSPRDYALIKESKSELLDSDGVSLDVVADDRIQMGGCLIETETGSLDGRLQAQIQKMYETLMRAYQAGATAP